MKLYRSNRWAALVSIILVMLLLPACGGAVPPGSMSSGDMTGETGKSQAETTEEPGDAITPAQPSGSTRPSGASAKTTTSGSSRSDITKVTAAATTARTTGEGTFIVNRSSLQNTAALLTGSKKLTVAYFGGSVTQGAGATDIETYSWRALTTKWLREQYPQADIREVNSCVGASGSRLGAYRVGRDILSQKPDLVFLEFAINDRYCRESDADVSTYYETIVRRLRLANPRCDIVCVYTTDSRTDITVPYFAQAQAQEQVAAHYALPSVNLGWQMRMERKLQTPYENGKLTPAWNKFFTDIVHPSNAGHEAYASIMQAFLKKLLQDGKASGGLKDYPLPAPKNAGLNLRMTCVEAAEKHLTNAKGWVARTDLVWGCRAVPYATTLYTDKADNELTYTFNGTSFGIFGTFSGYVEYSIDGGAWLQSSITGDHPLLSIRDLEAKTHTIRLRAANASASKPMKIAAFLVG